MNEKPEELVRRIIAKHYPEYRSSYKGRRVTMGLEIYEAAIAAHGAFLKEAADKPEARESELIRLKQQELTNG